MRCSVLLLTDKCKQKNVSYLNVLYALCFFKQGGSDVLRTFAMYLTLFL